jgi:hypothetical protein
MLTVLKAENVVQQMLVRTFLPDATTASIPPWAWLGQALYGGSNGIQKCGNLQGIIQHLSTSTKISGQLHRLPKIMIDTSMVFHLNDPGKELPHLLQLGQFFSNSTSQSSQGWVTGSCLQRFDAILSG